MIPIGTRVKVKADMFKQHQTGTVVEHRNTELYYNQLVDFDNSGRTWFNESELKVIVEPEFVTVYSIYSGDVDSEELNELQKFVDTLPRKSELGDFLQELINTLRGPSNTVTLQKKAK